MKKPFKTLCIALLSICTLQVVAQKADTTKPIKRINSYPLALVDYDAFEGLVKEVKLHRKARLLSLVGFKKKAKEQGVIILDTRSDSMFNAVHVKGAIHLNFSDFTQANLEKIIPNTNCTVLIYCNNNFDNSPFKLPDFDRYFTSKSYIPREKITQQLDLSVKPLTLALNIPTYINLYGYGYKNVYELGELVKVYENKIEFEGTAVTVK